MTFIDAYQIVENYTNSLANGIKGKDCWVRISSLKNSKSEICAAFKLFFAHALFWLTLPNDRLKLYEQSLSHIGDFCEDNLVDEMNQINKILNNRNPFTRLRDKTKQEKLVEEKKQIEQFRIHTIMEGCKYKEELSDFISWFLRSSKAFKKMCNTLPENEMKKDYPNLMGNFVCDIYEAAHIQRDYNDTEYFWPVEKLYSLSKDPKFDHLFGKYKEYIYQMYCNFRNIQQ